MLLSLLRVAWRRWQITGHLRKKQALADCGHIVKSSTEAAIATTTAAAATAATVTVTIKTNYHHHHRHQQQQQQHSHRPRCSQLKNKEGGQSNVKMPSREVPNLFTCVWPMREERDLRGQISRRGMCQTDPKNRPLPYVLGALLLFKEGSTFLI